MSFENPTRLRIGMHGNFGGKDYRLIGRVVMGETEDGETYYWNEFNLQAKDGSSADLVYEETERGGEWRLFTMFEPEYPLTAADAATKRVGDSINLTGEDVRITLRSASRVYHIEGEAPEGIEVGDVANYFNAEAGDIMQVVSWTGEDVEFYNGVNLARGVVNSAFNLPPEPAGFSGGKIFSSLSGSSSGNYDSGIKFLLKGAAVLFVFYIFIGRNFSCSTDYEASPVKKISAGPPPLVVGATGQVDDKYYRITSHAVVEIAEVGSKWERHEYQLTDDYGTKALLVCGDQPAAADWVFFELLSPMLAPAAKQLAAKKTGDLVELDGYTGKVGGLFLSTMERTDGEELPGLKNGAVSYGFRSANEHQTLLARWNEAGLQLFRGRTLPAKKLTACFNPALAVPPGR